MNQAYKTNLSHAINIARIPKNQATDEDLIQEFDILQQFNRMDFSQPWNKQNSTFECELSFTWLDWRIADTLDAAPDFQITDIDEE